MISQGEVWWADLGMPHASGAGFRRPVVIVQSDTFNRSRVPTVICVPLTGNVIRADAPGNVLLTAQMTGLKKDSVANVSQIIAVDKAMLDERVGKLSRQKLELIFAGIDIVLGR